MRLEQSATGRRHTGSRICTCRSTIENELDVELVGLDVLGVDCHEFVGQEHPIGTGALGAVADVQLVVDLEAQCNVQSLARLKGRDALRRDQVREDIIGARVVALGGHWGIVCQQEAASLFGGGVLRHVALFGAH